MTITALIPRTGGADSDDDEDDLVKGLSSKGLLADSDETLPCLPVSFVPGGTTVQEIELAVAPLIAKLDSHREVLPPTSYEHVFATSLIDSLSAGGMQNLETIDKLLEYVQLSASTSPHLWKNQHAACKLQGLAVRRKQLIEEACGRVYKALSDSQAPEQGDAALAAMGQYRLFQKLITLPQRLQGPLSTMYESVGLRVLTSLVEMMTTGLSGVRTPANILTACDATWKLGNVDAANISALRQLCQLADHAIGVTHVASAAQGQVAKLTTLYGQLQALVAETHALLAEVEGARKYVERLRARCTKVALPQPEEWVDSGCQQLSLSTIVEFVERREATAGAERVGRDTAVANAKHAAFSAATRTDLVVSQAREQHEKEIARVTAQNEEYASEILRLQQLLIAAQVPFDSKPATRAAWQGQVASSAVPSSSVFALK